MNQFLKTKNRATLSLAQSHWATVGVLLWLVSVLALTLWINFRHIKPLYCSRPNYGYTTTFRRNYIMTYVMPTPKHTTIININIFIVLTNISRCLLVCSPRYMSLEGDFEAILDPSLSWPAPTLPDVSKGVVLLIDGGSSVWSQNSWFCIFFFYFLYNFICIL